MARAPRIALGLAVAAALGTLAVPAAAQVRGSVGVTVGTRGHWHGGWGPRVGVGIGFAAPIYVGPYDGYYGPAYGSYYAPAYGAPVVVAPPVVYESGPVPMTQPEPVIYPRNGQSAARMETDRRECNRWAIGQPNAMGDASVFHRATLACMEGRGYTVR